MKKKKISIVTGGAGFIGSNLVDQLVKKGHKVIVLDNLSSGNFQNIEYNKDKIEFIKCDLSEEGAWCDKFFKSCSVYDGNKEHYK